MENVPLPYGEQKVPWNWAAHANKQVFFIQNAWQGRWQLQHGLMKIDVVQKRHNFSLPTLQVVEEKKQKTPKQQNGILSKHQTGAINRLVRYTAAEAPPTPPTLRHLAPPTPSPGSSLHVFHPRSYCTPFVQPSASRASTRSQISLEDRCRLSHQPCLFDTPPHHRRCW